MKVLIRLVIISLILIGNKSVLAQSASGTQTTAVPFLILNPDSRFGGMGESGSGLADNSSAIFWNPAGIAFLTGTEVSITHSNWLPQFQLDLFYDYLTFRHYMEDIGGSLTASITYMNYGEFVRTTERGPEEVGKFTSFDAALTVGYAAKLHPDWGIGLNFRLIHSKLADQGQGNEQGQGSATSVSFDIAAMWRPYKLDLPLLGDIGQRLSIGVNLSNLGPKIYYIDQAQADPIPTNFRLGFAYQIFAEELNSLVYTLDFSKLLVSRDTTSRDEFYKAIVTSWYDQPMSEEFREVVTTMGLEYTYGTPDDFLFAIRTGFFYEDPAYGNRKFLSMGAGIRFGMYGFDFSYISTSVFPGGDTHPLSDTLRFSLLIGWGAQTKTSTVGLPRGI